MATKKKPSNAKNSASKAKAKQKDATELIVMFVLIAVAILLFISNLGVGGVVGGAVSNFLFGVFGLVSYVIPFGIIYCIVSFIILKNRREKHYWVRLIPFLLFIFFLCAFFNLWVYGSDVVKASATYHYSFSSHLGGGFIGGLISYYLVSAFGLIGAYVISVIVMILSFVLAFEFSLLQLIRKKSNEIADYNEHRRNVRSIRREEEKKRKISERQGVGVTANTTIEKDKKRRKTDRMREIYENDDLDTPKVDSAKVTRLSSDGMQEIISEQKFVHPEEASFENTKSRTIKGNFVDDKSTKEDVPVKSVPEPVQSPASVQVETKKEEPVNSPKPVSNGEPVNYNNYQLPPTSLLAAPKDSNGGSLKSEMEKVADNLEETFKTFGIDAEVTEIICGPTVTRFEITPPVGVKVSKILNLSDDIKLNLAVPDIRIEAPVPGKAVIGIEVPNKKTASISFRELLESKEFKSAKSKIAVTVGKDIGGKVIVSDVGSMPHLLIAGTTGSGKSVCSNSLILSMLFRAKPDEVKFVMIDPKKVELAMYNGIPHMLHDVVTDPKQAASVLNALVIEMNERYEKFAERGVRNLEGYNQALEKDEPKMPQIIIVIDELADLMMAAAKEVEESICRIAQLARAAGMHLIIATQRPSVDVVTGLIKANMPSRLALKVSSQTDSRTILDMGGAEKLLGKGDMLFFPAGLPKPIRVQGAWIPDEEIKKILDFIKAQAPAKTGVCDMSETHEDSLKNSFAEKLERAQSTSNNITVGIQSDESSSSGGDPLFADAGRIIVDKEKASIGMLQRYLKVGFNRAARIMDELEEAGVVGPEMGTKPRTVQMSVEDFENYLEQNG